MDRTKLLCIKFNFGVPLEDIFPSDDIHPRLQNLFDQTKVALNNSHSRLNDILEELDISLDESLELKKKAINGKLHYNEGLRPSSFLWLLRHFFGLLPLPLFPSFTDGEVYKWEYLSTICKLNKLRSSRTLESEISWSLHKLPKANILLIYSFVQFLRKICLKRPSLKRFDVNNIRAVTIYFSSSLFLRPYRPGFVTKTDRLYHPLLFYIIVNWSRIRRVTSDLSYKLSSVAAEPANSTIEVYKERIQKKLADCICQTSSWLLLEKNKDQDGEKNEGLKSRNIVETEIEIIPVLDTEKVGERNNSSFEFLPEENGEKKNPDDLKEEIEENTKNQIQPNISGDYSNSCVDSPSYEEISNENKQNLSSNSESFICQKNEQKHITPNYIKEKLKKANRSLVNVISKMRSKQEQLKSKSGSKLEKYKYDLLKNSEVTKVQSLHVNHSVKESPNIKYKKLKTL